MGRWRWAKHPLLSHHPPSQWCWCWSMVVARWCRMVRQVAPAFCPLIHSSTQHPSTSLLMHPSSMPLTPHQPVSCQIYWLVILTNQPLSFLKPAITKLALWVAGWLYYPTATHPAQPVPLRNAHVMAMSSSSMQIRYPKNKNKNKKMARKQ